MRRFLTLLLIAAMAASVPLTAQKKKTTPAHPPAKPVALKTATPR